MNPPKNSKNFSQFPLSKNFCSLTEIMTLADLLASDDYKLTTMNLNVNKQKKIILECFGKYTCVIETFTSSSIEENNQCF